MGRAAVQSAATTRERILDAAVLRFSRQSYEETGLREIAADVGVDVAYVHRCFGSKQRLFAEAVRTTAAPERLLQWPEEDVAAALARQAFARDPAGRAERVGPLDIAHRSLTSPEAVAVLREFVAQEVVAPLGQRLGASARKAAMITALLAGISIMRNVLRIEALGEPEGGELEALIVHVIQGIARADLADQNA